MTADVNERLGRTVTVLRAERRMQRKALAALTGLSYAFLSDIESGKRGMSLATLTTIGAVFALTPAGMHRRAESLPALTPVG